MTTEKTQAVMTAEDVHVLAYERAGVGYVQAAQEIATLCNAHTAAAVEAARAEGRRAGLEAAAQVRSLLEAITETFEAAVRHAETKGQGGQSVTFTGDFGHVPPSTVGRMRWWAREFRTALLAAPVEAPRGEWLGVETHAVGDGGWWVVVEHSHAPIVKCPTREDAECIAEMLREVGRRLRP